MIYVIGWCLTTIVVIGWSLVLIAATRSDLKQWREMRKQKRS